MICCLKHRRKLETKELVLRHNMYLMQEINDKNKHFIDHCNYSLNFRT